MSRTSASADEVAAKIALLEQETFVRTAVTWYLARGCVTDSGSRLGIKKERYEQIINEKGAEYERAISEYKEHLASNGREGPQPFTEPVPIEELTIAPPVVEKPAARHCRNCGRKLPEPTKGTKCARCKPTPAKVEAAPEPELIPIVLKASNITPSIPPEPDLCAQTINALAALEPDEKLDIDRLRAIVDLINDVLWKLKQASAENRRPALEFIMKRLRLD